MGADQQYQLPRLNLTVFENFNPHKKKLQECISVKVQVFYEVQSEGPIQQNK